MKKRRHTPTRESWERLQIEYRAGQLRRAGARKPFYVPVLARRRPMLPEARVVRVAEGTPIREVVELAYPQVEYRRMARVAIDGEEVRAAFWERPVRRGEIMAITLVPGIPGLLGSDTLRNVLTLVFTVGGAAITQFVGGVEGWLIGTALTLVGPWILNLLIPPAEIQDIQQIGYALRGSRNQTTPWETIPKIYGRHKVFPPLGARPYSETIGDDLFVRALFVVGFGPLLIEALKIGDQPVLDGEGNAAFADMEIEIRSGYATDPPITLVTQDVGEESVGQEIIFEAPSPLIRTTEADTDEISLDIEFPEGLGNTTGDSVNGWSVLFRLMYRPFGFGEDAWLEVDEPVAAVLNDIATIQTVEGQIAYLATVRGELAAQVAILAGIDLGDRVWTEEVSLTILEYIQIWVNALNQTNDQGDATYAEEIADFLAELFNLEDLALTFTIGIPGAAWVTILESMDKIKIAVDVVVEISRISNYIAQGYGPDLSTFPWWAQLLIRWRGLAPLFDDPPPDAVRVAASKMGVVRRGFRWKVPRGRYDVKVIRVSEPVDTGEEQFVGVKEKAFWSVLRSIHYQDPVDYARLPPLAMIAMRVKAGEQFNGVLDQVNMVATAILPIPEPDGEGGYNFAAAPTRNPAWAFLDCLTGPHQPRAITMDRMDLDAVYEWGQACAAEDFTEDGGPTKEGRTFDLVTLKATTTDKMARTITSGGKAGFTRVGGLYSVVRDVEQTVPVAHFTPANSWGFRGEKNHAPQPHGLRVSFIDENADWNQAERLVFHDGYDVDTATRYENLSLTGVTDARQVWADARYFLAVAQLRPRRFSWNTDLNWAIISRGMLVRITHDVPLWGLAFGRIINQPAFTGGTVLKLDNFVPLKEGIEYQMIVVYPDGYGHTVTLSAAGPDGEYSEVSTPDDFPYSPPSAASAGGVAVQQGALFMLGTTGNITQDLIVTDIEPDSGKAARITAVDAAPGVHRDPGDPIPPFDPNVDIPPILEEPAPPAPVFRLYPAGHPDAGDPVILSNEQVLIVGQDGTLTPQIIAYLEPAIVPRGRLIPFRLQRQMRRLADFESEGGPDTVNPWVGLPDMPATVLDVPLVPVIEGKRYDFRLRYISQDGIASPWTTITDYLVIGKTAPPPDVESLYLENFQVVRWTYPSPPVDLAGFLVRASSDPAATWESAAPVNDAPMSAQTFPVASLPAGAIVVFVKAVDTGGRVSVNPAILSFTNTAEQENIVEEFVFDNGYWEESPVISLNVWINPAGNLELDAPIMGTPGNPITDASIVEPFPGAKCADSFYPDTSADVVGAIVLLAFDTASAPFIPARLTYTITMEQGNAFLLDFNDDGSQAIPQSKQYTNDGITYALALVFTPGPSGLARRPVVDQAVLTFDTPDLEEIIEDVLIPSGGARLTLTKPFRAIKIVNVAIQDDPSNAATSVLVVDKQALPGPGNGPYIRGLNSGADADLFGDARIRGY